ARVGAPGGTAPKDRTRQRNCRGRKFDTPRGCRRAAVITGAGCKSRRQFVTGIIDGIEGVRQLEAEVKHSGQRCLLFIASGKLHAARADAHAQEIDVNIVRGGEVSDSEMAAALEKTRLNRRVARGRVRKPKGAVFE